MQCFLFSSKTPLVISRRKLSVLENQKWASKLPGMGQFQVLGPTVSSSPRGSAAAQTLEGSASFLLLYPSPSTLQQALVHFRG
jgi:hypothetical protein